MSHPQKETGKITEKYCTEYSYLSSIGLARMLKQDYPLLFTSIDHARGMVRAYRGSNGEKNRKSMKSRIILKSIQVPPQTNIKFEPYRLPKVNNNCLLIADLHMPFHDMNVIEAEIQYAKEHDVNTIIMLGDVIDCYALSRFLKIPNSASFEEEREQFWGLIDYINQELPDVQIFWYEGNHEKRWQTYMMSHAPEIFHVSDFQIPELFNLRELGVTWIDKCQYIRAGKINLLHGHEYPGASSSVNPARGLFLKTKSNCCVAHYHRISMHDDKDINGTVIGCWSIGCSCQLNPEYMPLNQWQNGFAHLIILPDGNFTFENKKIIKGKVY